MTPKTTSEWENEFDKKWNKEELTKQNILSIQQNSAYDETKEFIVPNFQEIKDFIRTLILQAQKKAIKTVSPEQATFIFNLVLHKQKELLKNVNAIITARMFAIADEPLDKRQSGYDELLDIRDRINKIL